MPQMGSARRGLAWQPHRAHCVRTASVRRVDADAAGCGGDHNLDEVGSASAGADAIPATTFPVRWTSTIRRQRGHHPR